MFYRCLHSLLSTTIVRLPASTFDDIKRCPLQPQPPAQRPGEGEFVHEFEVAAEGHAAG